MHDIMVQELLLSDVIEFFLLILIIYILYQCCLCVYRGISSMARQQQRRRRRNRLRRNDNHRVPVSDDNDLQQIIRDEDTERRRIRNDNNSQQTAGVRSSSNNNCQATTISNVTTAQRKELIEKNLYYKRITREESVRELAMLLAASRVGTAATATPLPIGGIHNNDNVNNVSNAINNENETNELDEEQQQEKMVERNMKSNFNFDSNNDAPLVQHGQEEIMTLPLPLSQSTTSTLTLNQVLTPSFDYDFSMLEAQEQQHDASLSSSQPSRQVDAGTELSSSSITITPGTTNNKWNVIIKNVRTGDATSTTTSTATHPQQQQQQCKIECSICLDTFISGEEIAWAKDSGSTSIEEVGCDHIFHKECLISWLLHRDECPLCRRLLVHADADVRFANW